MTMRAALPPRRRDRPPPWAASIALATAAALAAGRGGPPAAAQPPIGAASAAARASSAATPSDAPPASARPRPAARPPAADAPVHTVRPGESALSIAMAYGTTVEALKRANGLGWGAFVYAGQRLVVAGAGAAATHAAATVGAGDIDAGARSDGDPSSGSIDGVAPDDTGSPSSPSGRRIVVDLSDQRLWAYDGSRLVRTVTVSTGAATTPTPVGTFAVYLRLPSQHMTGADYDLPGVPDVQYFFADYALHGAYWHQSFGTPVSHGCVNATPADAAWLWDFATLGTPVEVVP